MSIYSEAGAGGNKGEITKLSLKQFHSAGRGFWSHVSDADWNDWRWQLKNRITSLEQLQRLMPTLSPEEHAGTLLANTKLALAITPYFFNLIDPADENCPIRWQVIPRIEETNTASWEMTDPCGEDAHSPVPGLVHRYPDRVLFLVTDRCASYCRYCTRSRLVSNASGYDFHPEFEKQIDYIRRTPTIRDVLLSGGDPLLLSDDKLEYLLGQLRAIPHVEFLRIGSRIPIFLPQRITPALCAMLRKFHPLFLSIHSNHPRELTTEVREALGRLADAGIPLGNQSVLLRNVNDDVTVMRALVQKLLMCRVKPYYLYQCDLIAGSAHLRASVRKGLEVMEELRGHTTGYAVPQYVIDAPGGGGKVPINPEYVLSRNHERVVIRNFEGKIFEYPEAADGTPLAEAPRKIEEPELVKPAMARESIQVLKTRLGKILAALKQTYPDAHCELNYRNPLELLVATILSAQCNDKQVNIVTEALFKKYRTAADYANAEPAAFEQEIKRIGLYRNKAKNIQAAGRKLVERHGGQVPDSMEALVELDGVGRKTANVVLGNAFDINCGIVVDTHVARLSERLGLTREKTPEKIEQALVKLLPQADWCLFSHLLIWHGRRRCFARSPDCAHCEVLELCPRIGLPKLTPQSNTDKKALHFR